MKVYKCAQILFGSAINAFGLPIDFKMERERMFEPDSQSFGELMSEFENELAASIRNNIIGGFMQVINLINESVG